MEPQKHKQPDEVPVPRRFLALLLILFLIISALLLLMVIALLARPAAGAPAAGAPAWIATPVVCGGFLWTPTLPL